MRKINTIIIYVILIIIVATGAYHYYDLASTFEKLETDTALFPISRKGYVSDEIWYVNSARNLLRNIFGAIPRMDYPHATLVFLTDGDLHKALTLANSYGIKIVGGGNTFSKVKALYVNAPSIDIINSFAKSVNAIDVVYGWILGDAEIVYTYMNLEHPPMTKYIIALLMYTIGDRPIVWRIPSIVMGIIIIIMTFFLVYELTKTPILGLIAAAVVALDPMTKIMSAIALIDVYAAAFTLVTLYLGIKGRIKIAALAMGFASTFKFTAIFATIPLIFIYLNKQFKKNLRLLDIITNVISYIFLLGLSFIFFQLLVSIPIILKIGINSWLDQSLFGAVSWHLIAKCLDLSRGCPQYSAPWEWFFGINSFPIYISPSINAQGFIPAYALSFVLMLITIPSMTKENNARFSWYMLFGTFAGYMIIWILGSKTQYSFYAIQLTPLIYIYLVTQIYEYLNRENIIMTINTWKKVLMALINAILSIFK